MSIIDSKKKLKESVDSNNKPLIGIFASEILEEDPNDYCAKYFFAYSEYERNPVLLKTFFTTPIKHTKEETEEVLNHVIDFFLEKQIKNLVEEYIIRQQEIDIEAFLFDYYDALLNTHLSFSFNNVDTILVFDDRTKLEVNTLINELKDSDFSYFCVNVSEDKFSPTYYAETYDRIKNAKNIIEFNMINKDEGYPFVNIAQELNKKIFVFGNLKDDNITKAKILNDSEKDFNYLVDYLAHNIINVRYLIDNELIETKELIYGKPYGALPKKVKKGYDLSEFHYDGTEITNNSIVQVRKDHDVKATFTPKRCSLIIRSDGTSDNEFLRPLFGTVMDELPIFTREGYNFLYFENEETHKPFNIGSVIDEIEIKLIAKWEPKSVKVTFNTDSADNFGSITLKYGDKYGSLPTPVRQNYEFLNYELDGKIITSNTKVQVYTDHALTAKWEKNVFTVSFDTNGGNELKPISVTYGEKYPVLPTPIKEGYVFTSFELNGKEIKASTKVSTKADHVLVAKWTEKKEPVKTTTKTEGEESTSSKTINSTKSTNTNKETKNSTDSSESTSSKTTKETSKTKETKSSTDSSKSVKTNIVIGSKHVEFGSYPQTVINDQTLITKLEKLTKTNERGYYVLDGNEYFKAVSNVFSTSTSLPKGKTFFFKVEPVEWRILKKDGNKYFLLSEKLLFSKCIDQNSNNYEKSSIREYLNNTLYNTLFTQNERNLVNQVYRSNSAETTGYPRNQYVCQPTNDKVFLLNYQEVNSKELGFDNTYAVAAREALCTDYCVATGISTNTSKKAWWWLSSPNANKGKCMRLCSNSSIYDDCNVYADYYGIRPAIEIDISNIDAIVSEKENNQPTKELVTIDSNSILFGSFPQTVETDNSIIKRLEALTSTNARGYYEYSGKEYEKYQSKVFTSSTIMPKGKTFYFRVEPVKWRILKKTGDTYFLLSEKILFAKDIDKTSNNYEKSSIREYLNIDTYNKLFTNAEKQIINTVTRSNSVSSTGYSSNKYACNPTNDKVFLLSYQEVNDKSLGFEKAYSVQARIGYCTDYCVASGISVGSGNKAWWWLSSPNAKKSDCMRLCSDASTYDDCSIRAGYYGIRPAIEITVNTTKSTTTDTIVNNTTNKKEDDKTKVIVENNIKYIYYGSYPQTAVTSTSLIKALDSATVSNGIITYNNKKYKKITSNQFTTGPFNRGKTFYFEYEPIKWRVLDETPTSYFLLADKVLCNDRIDSNSNNYANSHIRAYLNGEFYNNTFTTKEKKAINNTRRDNSINTSNYKTNSFMCANTDDYVFLLNVKEASNPSYGFSTALQRKALCTDYTVASGQATYSGNYGWWWLSTPGTSLTYNNVCAELMIYDRVSISADYYGVRPAMIIKK